MMGVTLLIQSMPTTSNWTKGCFSFGIFVLSDPISKIILWKFPEHCSDDNSNDEYSINQILLGEGLAYEYSGEKRKPFREWALQRFLNNYPETPIPSPLDNINDPEVFSHK